MPLPCARGEEFPRDRECQIPEQCPVVSQHNMLPSTARQYCASHGSRMKRSILNKLMACSDGCPPDTTKYTPTLDLALLQLQKSPQETSNQPHSRQESQIYHMCNLKSSITNAKEVWQSLHAPWCSGEETPAASGIETEQTAAPPQHEHLKQSPSLRDGSPFVREIFSQAGSEDHILAPGEGCVDSDLDQTEQLGWQPSFANEWQKLVDMTEPLPKWPGGCGLQTATQEGAFVPKAKLADQDSNVRSMLEDNNLLRLQATS